MILEVLSVLCIEVHDLLRSLLAHVLLTLVSLCISIDTAAEARTARRAALEASLRDVLFQIIRFVNEKKDHIPPVPNFEGIAFPYEITISRYSLLLWYLQRNEANTFG